MPSSRSRPRPSAAPTSTSSTASFPAWSAGPAAPTSSWGKWSRKVPRVMDDLPGDARVVAIARFGGRQRMAQNPEQADVIDYDDVAHVEALNGMTGGRCPDSCIGAGGLLQHRKPLAAWYHLANPNLM